MPASIQAIVSYLPGAPVTNEHLAQEFPEWSVDRIAAKTGIHQRHFAAAGECASDLAVMAAHKLFRSGIIKPEEIDYILLCTQSPDYLLPTTACLLQQRLNLPKAIGALDFNLGCSGYVYGLGLANGLIHTGQASRLLLITADTYSKFIAPADRSLKTIFGDGATVTLISAAPRPAHDLRPTYVYGTDGRGAEHLILRAGGTREPWTSGTREIDPQPSAKIDPPHEFLWMNGPEIFHFALKVVPACLQELLAKSGTTMDDIDLFVFHQANQYMLDHLRSKLAIPEDKFYLSLASCGNTVSGTIPIALEDAVAAGRLKAGDKVVLLGFGVGLSWGATLLSWPFLDAPGA